MLYKSCTSPCSSDELESVMNPFTIETRDELFNIVNNLQFTEQLNYLHVEFQHFLRCISKSILVLHMAKDVV